jgi:hypothetical protein
MTPFLLGAVLAAVVAFPLGMGFGAIVVDCRNRMARAMEAAEERRRQAQREPVLDRLRLFEPSIN